MSYMCPDVTCENDKQERKKGKYCPKCGKPLEKVGLSETFYLNTQKMEYQKDPEKVLKIEEKKKQQKIKKEKDKKIPKILRGLPETENTRFIVNLSEFAPGRVSTHNNKNELKGVVEIANEELIIYKKSVFRNKDRGVKHIRYDQITSIDYDAPKTFGYGAIQLYLSSIEYSLRSVDKTIEHYYDIIREKMNAANQATSQTPNTSQELDPLESLKKLGELKDLGVITEEEFEEKKKDLLSQI